MHHRAKWQPQTSSYVQANAPMLLCNIGLFEMSHMWTALMRLPSLHNVGNPAVHPNLHVSGDNLTVVAFVVFSYDLRISMRDSDSRA